MLQNRVNPRGELHRVSARGSLMGNRGILHDAAQEIVRAWAHHNWVTCRLEFGSFKRPKPFSTLNNYSELFFLDEATAFAAGHRPCNTCQRLRCKAFKMAWLQANVDPKQHANYKLNAIDKVLHAERIVRGGGKKVFQESMDKLPLGTIFEHEGKFYAVTASGCRPWGFEGYGQVANIQVGTVVDVLTPASVVRTFAMGFVPEFHHSIASASEK